jgi:hypothetical protein
MPEPLSVTRKQALAATGCGDLDARGAGIDGVFDQFLGSAGRSFDDLAGGDLVDQRFGQQLDLHPLIFADSQS